MDLGFGGWSPGEGRRMILPWALVWMCVAAAMLSAFLAKKSIDPLRQLEFQTQARYAVGASLFMKADQPNVKPEGLEELETEASGDALLTLRLAIVKAYLQGPDLGRESLRAAMAMPMPVEHQEAAGVVERLLASGPEAVNQAEIALLIQQEGWFGRLAAGIEAREADPHRIAAVSSARKTFIAIKAAQALFVAALIAGSLLLILGRIHWFQGRLLPNYLPAEESTLPFIYGFSWYLLAFLAFSLFLAWLNLGQHLWMLWGLLFLFPLWWIAVRHSGVSEWDLVEGLGWEPGQGFWAEIGAGVVGYLAGMPILFGGFLLTRYLGQDFPPPVSPVLEDLVRGNSSPYQWLILFVTACLWAPLVEETMFRGALFHHLRSLGGFLPAALLSGLLFAMAHPYGLAGIPQIMALGLVLAALREWRGSLLAPIVAHMLYNLVGMSYFGIHFL